MHFKVLNKKDYTKRMEERKIREVTPENQLFSSFDLNASFFKKRL